MFSGNKQEIQYLFDCNKQNCYCCTQNDFYEKILLGDIIQRNKIKNEFSGESVLLENVCAIHLHKKYGDKLYFYNKSVEVDFYVPEEAYAVQASYTVMTEETRETYNREVDALKK